MGPCVGQRYPLVQRHHGAHRAIGPIFQHGVAFANRIGCEGLLAARIFACNRGRAFSLFSADPRDMCSVNMISISGAYWTNAPIMVPPAVGTSQLSCASPPYIPVALQQSGS